MASPPHYTRGRIDVWDFIRDQSLGFHRGNAIKYICRAGYKEDEIEDLEKAIHYLQNEIEHITTTSERVQRDLSSFTLLFDEWTTDPEIFDR
jgi:hypothetical protein